MNEILRFILPLYFIVYFGLVFVAKSVMVAIQTGKNPLVFPADDSAYGLIGRYFKITIVSMFVYVMLYGFFPEWHHYFLPISQLEFTALQYLGLLLLVAALIWSLIAQVHMRNSWRIGLDTHTKTELISSGLFSISRNPIFLGMIVSLLGLFFCSPNALTGIFLILAYVLIQIQIRLEEEFLFRQHGQSYLDYKSRVRRLI